MKKYIVMFGLTLVMGLFFANNVTAQGNWEDNPTNPAAWTTGNVGFGINNPIAPLHVHMTAPGLSALQRMVRTGPQGAGITFDKANAGETAAGDWDFIGSFVGRLHDGEDYVPRAGIRFRADGSSTKGAILFQTHDGLAGGLGTKNRMIIDHNGNIGIGTMSPMSLLSVAGKITAQEVEVTMTGWADFVFNDDYDLMSLYEVEQFIRTNRHLPDVPSESEVLENGINVGQMSAILLQKVEELTLHIIELNKRIEELEK